MEVGGCYEAKLFGLELRCGGQRRGLQQYQVMIFEDAARQEVGGRLHYNLERRIQATSARRGTTGVSLLCVHTAVPPGTLETTDSLAIMGKLSPTPPEKHDRPRRAAE